MIDQREGFALEDFYAPRNKSGRDGYRNEESGRSLARTINIGVFN